jgi:hypothetical protein
MIIDNSCLGLANTQDERFTPFLVIKILFQFHSIGGLILSLYPKRKYDMVVSFEIH